MLDGLGLLLGVLLVRSAPVDLDVDVVLRAKFLGGVLGADAGGLEDGIALGLGDEAQDEGAFGRAAREGERHRGGEEEQTFHRVWGRERSGPRDPAKVSRRPG